MGDVSAYVNRLLSVRHSSETLLLPEARSDSHLKLAVTLVMAVQPLSTTDSPQTSYGDVLVDDRGLLAIFWSSHGGQSRLLDRVPYSALVAGRIRTKQFLHVFCVAAGGKSSIARCS